MQIVDARIEPVRIALFADKHPLSSMGIGWDY
jgi:hypothetical protein